MSTVTPNFNWPVPTSTDLVKDGATAIEALGDSIDASLVDLKGGTTGQVLAKASNTDLDYTWTSPTTGDITGVTAGTGLTGGGTSGDVTVSFDVANYGGGQWAAGKNQLINGDFAIWQRGTTFNAITGGTYFADRWCGNYVNGTVNATQQSFTPGTAPVSGYEAQYYLQLARTTTHGSISDYIAQRVEDVRTFANQTVTFSFWAKMSTGTGTIGTYFTQYFGSGGSSETGIAGDTFSLTSSWQRFSTTHTFASISGKTIGTNNWIAAQLVLPQSEGNKTWQIWGVQLEAGSTATPFQTATGTIQGELAACQRYYFRMGGTNAYEIYGLGNTISTTQAYIIVQPKVTMRVYPTSIDYSTVGVATMGSAPVTATPVLGSSNSNNVLISCSGTGFAAANTFTSMLANNSTSSYVGLSAEL